MYVGSSVVSGLGLVIRTPETWGSGVGMGSEGVGGMVFCRLSQARRCVCLVQWRQPSRAIDILGVVAMLMGERVLGTWPRPSAPSIFDGDPVTHPPGPHSPSSRMQRTQLPHSREHLRRCVRREQISASHSLPGATKGHGQHNDPSSSSPHAAFWKSHFTNLLLLFSQCPLS